MFGTRVTRRWVAMPLILFVVLFVTACGAFSRDGKDSAPGPTPTPTYEEPSGFTLPRSAYDSDETFENCNVLADKATSRDEIGIIRHTVVFRDNLNQVVRRWQDPRFGIAFRVGDYVLTARHVAEDDPNFSPEDPRFRKEHRYDFYPVGELFESPPIFSRDFTNGNVFKTGSFVPATLLWESAQDADFMVFQVEDRTSDERLYPVEPARGLLDFDPICTFRLFFDDETGKAVIWVLGGKSFSDERSDRELSRYPHYEYYTVRVITFYGGFSFGPGASGSPVFLKIEDSYALVALAFARGSGNIGIGHDIVSIRDRILLETGIDIFK